MVKKLDKWCNTIWLVCLGILGVIVAFLLILNWNSWTPGAKGGAFLAVIMPLIINQLNRTSASGVICAAAFIVGLEPFFKVIRPTGIKTAVTAAQQIRIRVHQGFSWTVTFLITTSSSGLS